MVTHVSIMMSITVGDIPRYDTRLSSMHGSREAVYQGSHCNVNKRNLAQLPGLNSPGKLLTATAAATAGNTHAAKPRSGEAVCRSLFCK